MTKGFLVLFSIEQFLDENQEVVKQPEMQFRNFLMDANTATSCLAISGQFISDYSFIKIYFDSNFNSTREIQYKRLLKIYTTDLIFSESRSLPDVLNVS